MRLLLDRLATPLGIAAVASGLFASTATYALTSTSGSGAVWTGPGFMVALGIIAGFLLSVKCTAGAATADPQVPKREQVFLTCPTSPLQAGHDPQRSVGCMMKE